MENANRLYLNGSFSEAVDLVDKLIQQEDNKKLNLEATLLKGEILCYTEDYDNSLPIIIEVLEESEKLGNEIMNIKSSLLLSEIHYQLNNSDESYDLLLQADKKLQKLENISSQELIILKSQLLRDKGRYFQNVGYNEEAFKQYNESWELIKGVNSDVDQSFSLHSIGSYYADKRDYKLALKYYNRGLVIREKNNYQYLIASSISSIGALNSEKGEFKLAIEYFNKAMKIYKDLNIQGGIAKVHNYLGLAFVGMGELEDSLKNHKKALKINTAIGIQSRIAMSLHNIGIIYFLTGELDKALEYSYKSLEINELLKYKFGIAGACNNLGILYMQKGELEKSLNFHQRHLEIVINFNNKTDLAMSYVNLGTIYQMKGELDKALDYFKKSLDIDREIGTEIEIAESLYNLIKLSLVMDNTEMVDEYLNELKVLDDGYFNKFVKLRYKIAQALLLKSSPRTINKAKAQEILIELNQDEVIDHELTIFAKLNLCELLLTELRNTGNENVLVEFKELVEDLHNFAKEQNSWSLLAEIYLLQSSLALIELNLDKAQNLTNQAQIIADTKGLSNLSIKISNQFDRLIENQQTLERMVNESAPLAEILEEVHLEDFISKMINKKPEERVILPEKPAIVLLLDNSGISLFIKKFEHGANFKDDLIGGLISAIYTLSENVFSTHGSIQRIKHDEFTIILKQIDSLLFCYAFYGQSYSALQTLDKFIDALKGSKTTWKSLKREIPGLTASEKSGMELITNEIFTRKYIN